MKLIVGLGNPGSRYSKTRHNMGFMVVDALALKLGISITKNDFSGTYGRGVFGDMDVVLLKPETFMNLSGQSVQSLASYFKIDVSDIVIVYDDMALAPGTIRLRFSGSSGGHKGMQSIIEQLGTESIKRVRIGIGEPQPAGAIDFVLGKPSAEDQKLIDAAIIKARDAVVDALQTSFNHAMSIFN